MNKDEILKTIGEIELLLKKIKSGIYGEKAEYPSTEGKKVTNRSKRKSGSTKSITELVSRNFFDIAKSSTDVLKELKKQAVKSDPDVVRMTLMRFVRKRILEREGEGTTKNPWKYKKK
jgi:hypothetical protein